MPHEPELPQIHVQPGESHLIREPGILLTLLGSCVGITFWVERLHIGALCHPMLPSSLLRRARLTGEGNERRFVDFTIRDLATRLDALGVSRSETEVKVFGGADVLDFDHSRARPTIGKLNGEAAVHTLRVEGYRVAASCLGGQSGMQIQFNTNTGEVLLRRFERVRGAGRAHHPREPEAKTWN
jgi:chemotaxis protein CheD